LGFWNTMLIRIRSLDRIDVASSTMLIACGWSMILPSYRVLGYRSCIRLKQRSSVDLPHPDGPISAVIFVLVQRHVDPVQRMNRSVVEARGPAPPP
jgi:hypothetical protein